MDEIKSMFSEILARIENLENIIRVNEDLIQTNINLNKITNVQQITPLPKLKLETKYHVKCVPTKDNYILLIGSTFDIKDTLKTHGAVWSKDPKGWQIPASKLDYLCTEMKELCEFDTTDITINTESSEMICDEHDKVNAAEVFNVPPSK